MAGLSEHYARGHALAELDAVTHAAYLGARLPATYAAVLATLGMAPETLRGELLSLLDLGAGPGTASWAAASCCPRLEAVTQVDRSAALLALGARLGTSAGLVPPLTLAQSIADVSRPPDAWPAADLVIASYVLAEVPAAAQGRLLDAALASARRLLVLVEPGTPAGFARIHAARARCLASGMPVLAPCSHAGICPMQATDDWCHFAVRVPRSRRHRQLKGGTLGYEDEKFACLVVATRAAGEGPTGARVLRHPRVEKGRVTLDLCAPARPARVVVTRRAEGYRLARKLDWGGTWPSAPSVDDD